MKIKDHLDKIHERLEILVIEQVEIRKDLNHHIVRTDLLEKKQDAFESRVSPLLRIYHFLQVSGVLVAAGAAAVAVVKYLLP